MNIGRFQGSSQQWLVTGCSFRRGLVANPSSNDSTDQRSSAGPLSSDRDGPMASSAPNAVDMHCLVKSRDLFHGTACRHQTSPIAGTIFALDSSFPCVSWFRAIYHVTQSKQGISSIELGRRLGVTQTTAWKIKHKLKQVMLERDASKPLTGRVELDDAYLGGERTGGKRGRGAPGKTPFVAAVETTPEGKPVRLKMRRVTSFCGHEISAFAKRSLDPDCAVITDGLQCFGRVKDAGCSHQVVKTGSGSVFVSADRLSGGSTPLWAISNPPLLAPIAPSAVNM